MAYDAYLYEKARYAPDALSRLAEDLKLLEQTSTAHRELRAHLDTALRWSLRCCCELTGAELDAGWVPGLARHGRAHWKDVVKPALDAASRQGLELEDDASEAEDEFGDEGWRPDDDDDDAPWRADDDDQAGDDAHESIRGGARQRGLAGAAARTLSALADLADVIRRHAAAIPPDAELAPRLAGALYGTCTLVTQTIGGPWENDWPARLAERGREALSAIVCLLRDKGALAVVGEDAFDPLDEAWLSDVDPERTPEVEQAAERARRADLTKKTGTHSDLVPPKRYRQASLAWLLTDKVPGHDLCADYARSPRGTLVLHGEFHSGLHGIQWAIARHWFVDQLQNVGFVEWRDLVEDNLMAQDRGLWTVPRLLVGSLCPVPLWSGGGNADPCYAERMLEYRLMAGLPTVVTIERYALDAVNLRSRTVELLRAGTNVVLSRLSEKERTESGIEL